PSQQGQLASAMLVFGTSGALASTWPVHLVTPYIGWRGVFLVLAGLSFLAILILYFGLPVRKQYQQNRQHQQHQQINNEVSGSHANLSWQSYQPILTNPFFWRILPLGTFCYGGFIAIQTLWFGPWLIEVMEYQPSTAAQIVFGFNTVLLVAYPSLCVFLANTLGMDLVVFICYYLRFLCVGTKHYCFVFSEALFRKSQHYIQPHTLYWRLYCAMGYWPSIGFRNCHGME
ncbi:MAG: MFS transporter, partial [Burkholderiaceae bacterium]|nr:MFS transporter [Burkholderiaceae bacterium]